MQQKRGCGRGGIIQKRLNNGHMKGEFKRTYQVTEAQKIQEKRNTGGQYCATLKRLTEKKRAKQF